MKILKKADELCLSAFCVVCFVLPPPTPSCASIPHIEKCLQFNAVSVVPLIAQGWRQPTLGYACSVEVNAVGVVLFLRGKT